MRPITTCGEFLINIWLLVFHTRLLLNTIEFHFDSSQACTCSKSRFNPSPLTDISPELKPLLPWIEPALVLISVRPERDSVGVQPREFVFETFGSQQLNFGTALSVKKTKLQNIKKLHKVLPCKTCRIFLFFNLKYGTLKISTYICTAWFSCMISDPSSVARKRYPWGWNWNKFEVKQCFDFEVKIGFKIWITKKLLNY